MYAPQHDPMMLLPMNPEPRGCIVGLVAVLAGLILLMAAGCDTPTPETRPCPACPDSATVIVHDTVQVYDTLEVLVPVYDTVIVPVYQTVTDTVTVEDHVTVTDTVVVEDTVLTTIQDTLLTTIEDTLVVQDTVRTTITREDTLGVLHVVVTPDEAVRQGSEISMLMVPILPVQSADNIDCFHIYPWDRELLGRYKQSGTFSVEEVDTAFEGLADYMKHLLEMGGRLEPSP